MKKNFKIFPLVALIILSLSVFTFGQEQFGNIEGFIKDSAGAVVPSVTVTVRSAAGSTTAGFRRTVTTDSNGFFRLLQVPAGTYTVTTEAINGFAAATYENVQVALGKTTPVNVQVSVGSQSVTVDVLASSDSGLDTSSSEISTSISSQKIDLLPKGTNFTSILKVSPGTRQEPKSGGFTIDGASGAENTFVIDGQEVTNYRNAGLNSNNNVPFSIVQEVQVKSSGFNAEFGGATGGVINVVTKGGNNDFHGDFGIEFTPAKLQGKNRQTLKRFTSGTTDLGYEYYTAPQEGGVGFFPSFMLSGPVLKDKVWFLASYSPQIVERNVHSLFYTDNKVATRTLTAERDYTNKTINEYSFARIDANPFSNLRLTGTFLYNPYTERGQIPHGTFNYGSPSYTSAEAAARGGRQTANSATFQAVYTPFSSVVTTFRYSRGFLNEKLGNYGIAWTSARYICSAGNTSSNNFGADACTQAVNDPDNTQTVKDISIRTNYEGDVAYSFNGGGRHSLKGGYQRQSIFNDLLKGYTERVYLYYGRQLNNNPNWTTIATPTAGAIGHGAVYRYGERGQGSNLNQAIYIQDNWQIMNRLTLNLGVRIEKEALPSFNGFDAPFSFGWGDKVAPRIGGAFDLFGDGKTKIFGSYGKFYDRLKFKMAQGSFGGNFYRVDFFEIFANSGPYRTAFTLPTVLGNFDDRIGGACATTGFIGSGLSRCQNDYRVASNVPGADIEDAGGVDVDLKPYSQREFTFGAERELGRNFLLRGRYTNKKLLNTVEDAGAISASGSEVYITGNPGKGLHAEFLEAFGYNKPFVEAHRQYNAFEIALDKRFSNSYFFNVNYTYSRLRGNYSGLANSDEDGRSDPGVNRSFDLPMIGYTAKGQPDDGPLATDRPHVFNAYGAYVIDWKKFSSNSTEVGLFQTFQSGTPQTTLVSWIVPMILNERGDMGRTPMFYQTDITLTHRYNFGSDGKFRFTFNVNVTNLFDQKIVTGLQTTISNVATFDPVALGCTKGNYQCAINKFNSGAAYTAIQSVLNGADGKTSTYGLPSGYQGRRGIRFGFNFGF